MADRKVQLSIVADASGADRARQQLVSGFAKAAQDINRSFNGINKLEGLRSNIANTGAQLDGLRDHLRGVADELLRTGNNGARIEALRAQYRGLQSEVAGLERSLDRDQAAARRLEASLRAAGISSTQFGAARSQIEQMARALDQASREAVDFRRNAQNLFGGVGDVARSQTAVQAELAALRQRNALIGAGTELERVQRNIAMGNYAAFTAAQQNQLRLLAAEYDAKQRLVAVDRARGGAAAFAQGALSATPVGFMGGAAGAGLAAALGGGYAAATALEFERAAAALVAVSGDANRAAAELEYLRDEATRLGVDVISLTQSFVQLQAASKGTALEGAAARDIFAAVTEAGQRLNLTTSETEGALRAIGQMMSKGTVQAEELRGQLGDRLPGAFNIMARALGVTTAELGDMLKKGEVLSSEALPKFGAELRRAFGTDATTRIETTSANFNRLANELRLAASALGEFFNTAAGPGAGKLADVLRMVRESDVSLLANVGGGAAVGAVAAGPFGALPGAVVGAGAYGVKLRREQETRALQEFMAANVFGPTGGFRFDLPIPRPDALPALTGVDLLTSGVTPRSPAGTSPNGGTKTTRRADTSAADSLAMFRENMAAEARIIEQQGDLRRRLNLEILQAQGSDSQAALARLRDQYDVFTRDLADSAEGLDLAAKWFNVSEAKIALDDLKTEAEAAVAAAQARVQANALAAASAGPGERARLRADSTLAVGQAQTALDSVGARGDMFGGADIAATQAQLDRLVESARKASQGPFAQMFKDWENGARAMEVAATQWTTSTIDGIARMAIKGKADFRSLGESIIQDIIRIQLRTLAANLAGGGSQQGIGGFIGGAVGGFLNGLFAGGGSSGAIDFANQNPFGPVQYKAGGGMVTGPGSSTSDSIPAWLSNGEFVINAKAVRTFGRGMLENLNRGFAPPATRRYASGGYVGSGGTMAPMLAAPANIEIVNNTGAEVQTERVNRGGVDIERIVIGTLKKDAATNGEYTRALANTFGLRRRPGA